MDDDLDEEPMLECPKCNWIGEPERCVCSDEDAVSDKPVNEIKFNLCPRCKSDDLEDLD